MENLLNNRKAFHPDAQTIEDCGALIALALKEDVGQGDVTSQLLIPESSMASFSFRNRQSMVMAAGFLVGDVYKQLSVECEIDVHVADGEWVAADNTLITVKGNARGLLTGERVALNLLQRSAAVATSTRAFVEAVAARDVTILDTRKTMPAMRLLDKYSVLCGGGANHRMRLDDRILIKDNHIAVAGSISKAVEKARDGNSGGLLIEVECDTAEQFHEALSLGVDWIMLDNMSPERMKALLKTPRGNTRIEASGGVNLQTVKAIAESGVDAISVGAITHSAPAVDIGLDVELLAQ